MVKAVDLKSTTFAFVGSNPTAVVFSAQCMQISTVYRTSPDTLNVYVTSRFIGFIVVFNQFIINYL